MAKSVKVQYTQVRKYFSTAPNRCSVEVGDGTFHTRPWKPGEKKAYLEVMSYLISVPVMK
jgi:hypothetical protein